MIAEGCREAGVGHDQASDIIHKWKLSKVSKVTQGARDNHTADYLNNNAPVHTAAENYGCVGRNARVYGGTNEFQSAAKTGVVALAIANAPGRCKFEKLARNGGKRPGYAANAPRSTISRSECPGYEVRVEIFRSLQLAE